ncbi:MAG TPA: META domain-containing protein [Burkholderiaceae bacterium]|nr:META domain-containing protein [Burkholderiaceae bacterium]HQR72096.1 META domain-containing protein [Burkholderiaceae bacterium]
MPRQTARIAATLTALALAACATGPSTPAGRLAGTAWRAESIDGRPATDPQNPSTLRFFDRQLAGGSLGCNAYSTTFFADAAGLRFGELAPSRRQCAAPVMEQESRFSAVLTATRNSRIDDKGALLLLDEDGKVRGRMLPMTP